MPRPLRDQSAGLRHVVCRGNRRQAVFRDDSDRRRYLGLLEEVWRDHGWRIPAYCLMTNHVHLVVEVTEDTVSRALQWLSGRYGQAFNVRHGYVGHLFQGRFRMEHVEDEAYAFELVRYVDLNPVRAHAVADAAEWRWSSHRALLGLERPQPFHDVGWVLDRLSSDRAAAHAAYAEFVAQRRADPPHPSARDRSGANSRGQTPGHGPKGHVPFRQDVWERSQPSRFWSFGASSGRRGSATSQDA